jgi:hypothetical protein
VAPDEAGGDTPDPPQLDEGAVTLQAGLDEGFFVILPPVVLVYGESL